MVAPERDTPGNHGEALEQADLQIHGQGKPRRILLVAAEAQVVDDHQHEPAGDQGRADDERIEQDAPDEIAQKDADDRRRQERDDHADREAPRVGIAGHRDGDPPQAREIDRQDGEDRPELDQDGEGLVGLAVEPEEMLQQEEVPGRGHRQELGAALQHAKQRGLKQLDRIHRPRLALPRRS